MGLCRLRSSAAVLALLCLQPAWGLNPKKSFSQYSRTVWNQGQGLPQDTITAIAQTSDGYLWLGTDEGLARFDGYEFTLFNSATGHLPSNSIKTLAVGPDNSVWIGTADGLAHLSGQKSRFFSRADGLPDNTIDEICVDHTGHVWIATGGALVDFDGQKFRVFSPGKDLPITVRTVYEDKNNVVWVAGLGGVIQYAKGKFTPVVPWTALAGDLITRLVLDNQNNLWIAGSLGILKRSPDNTIRKFTRQEGLPDNFVRALWLDRDGNVWAGTNSGLARLQGDKFITEGPGDLIRCLFEDSEHDLWVGSRNGLSRLRDDVFTVYGKTEGWPSDSPNTVFQDRDQRLWVGFRDSALLLISPGGNRAFTLKDGFPAEEVFSIRQGQSGDLLMSTRAGFVRMQGSRFTTYVPPDEFGRRQVFDSLEEPSGAVWLAMSSGLARLNHGKLQLIVQSGPPGANAIVNLRQSKDGSLWAAGYQTGLWRLRGEEKRQFTTDDGLSSNQIRSLWEDSDGMLWIATFGGGLNGYHDGKFTHFTAKEGILSDNISNIVDDGASLWLGTTRGICRVAKQELRNFAEGKIHRLNVVNYGVEDGLRTGQAAPGYPVAGGGVRSTDGRLWFPTSNGLAVIDPKTPLEPDSPPIVHLVDLAVDGKTIPLSASMQLAPGAGRLQVRFTAIHLSAPERVEYFYKLDGVDADWVRAGPRRETFYNSLAHGKHRFRVRAQLPEGPLSEQEYFFEQLPKFYETMWFRVLCAIAALAAIWGAYQVRVRQLRYRFALVLDERGRLAREIHDTLAQGFVGISSQLEAVAAVLPEEPSPARDYLNLARKMARHSLTEARRAISDLRSSALERGDLATAVRSGAQMWTAGSDVTVDIEAASTGQPGDLPDEFEQHLLRITQEAVTNVVKHAQATKVSVKLYRDASKIHLRVVDNGRGFQKPDPFSAMDGHFGLIGMRERTERLGGEFRLASHPGEGTEIDVTVPLP